MDTITVTIPVQEFDIDKYCGIKQRCYLEEALDKAGVDNAEVEDCGTTRINDVVWYPTKPFRGMLLRQAFERGESVTVTLINHNNKFGGFRK